MKRLFRSKLVMTGMVLGVLAAAGLGVHTVQAQDIQDCSNNSIIRCGASSPEDFINKVRANNPDDLQAIYGNFGLSSGEYDEFAREAKMGTAKQDGTIVVDGQVVARNTWSIGREAKSYSKTYRVDGKTYHRSNATDVLKQDLPVIVWFNDQGKVEAAILAACGNPMGGDIVAPNYRCNQLKKEAVSGQDNTYRFSTDASAASGATVSRVVYDFGDGSEEVTRNSLTDEVTHTYDRVGTFTAKVTVYVKLPDGREVAANGSGCATRITVEEAEQAAWRCTSLRASRQTESDDEFAYTFRASTSSENASLASADFDFGDGNTTTNVLNTGTSNNISADHTYAEPGTYTAKATVYFEADDGAKAQSQDSDTCEVTVTVEQPVTPAATPPAPTLPNTGPAGAVGLFTGASALGALGYRWRANRRLSKVDDVVDRLLRK